MGKTAAAIHLATRLKCEIFSFDSRQFYRELAIGSAPPSAAERAQVKHHFIMDRSLENPLSAGSYADEALPRLREYFKQNQRVVLVGGSGLYLRALVQGLDVFPPATLGLRSKLQAELDHQGLAPLVAELQAKDPEYAEQADLQNPRRVVRALEVIRSSGRPYSAFRQKSQTERPFRSLLLGLNMPRPELYRRINVRAEQMLSEGLEAEARALYPQRQLPALQTVGYREWWPYFEQKCDRATVLAEIQKNTRRFAKRQLTWFRREENVHWFEPDQEAEIYAKIRSEC